MVNEFQAMISNIGKGFRCPSGLFLEGFDLICCLSQKKQTDKSRKKYNHKYIEMKGKNKSSYSKIRNKIENIILPVNKLLFEF